jgi:hypothetical protein
VGGATAAITALIGFHTVPLTVWRFRARTTD